MNLIFLKVHLGLGDLIICNGLIRVLAERHGKVVVPAKPHNTQTAMWMFSDDPRIEICMVDDDRQMLKEARRWPSIGVGLWSKRGLQEKRWSEGFYEDADVPFECRWSKFKLPEIPDTKMPDCGIVFRHQDPIRDYLVDGVYIPWSLYPFEYAPASTEPFQNHIPWLAKASEIHVIDSCFLCLADSIETRATRHVLHAYATAHDPYKKFGPPTLRKNWVILK